MGVEVPDGRLLQPESHSSISKIDLPFLLIPTQCRSFPLILTHTGKNSATFDHVVGAAARRSTFIRHPRAIDLFVPLCVSGRYPSNRWLPIGNDVFALVRPLFPLTECT